MRIKLHVIPAFNFIYGFMALLLLHFRRCLQKTLMSQHFWNKVILLPSQKSSAAFSEAPNVPTRAKTKLAACCLFFAQPKWKKSLKQ